MESEHCIVCHKYFNEDDEIYLIECVVCNKKICDNFEPDE